MSNNLLDLPPIDAVEIVDLRDLNLEQRDYMRDIDSAPCVRVTGDVAQTIALLWRNLPTGSWMRCHVPRVGFRFWADDTLVAQASVCWYCNNIHGQNNGQETMAAFDGNSTAAQELLTMARQVTGQPFDDRPQPRMNEHEERFIAAFVTLDKKGRYDFLLESRDPKRRSEFLNRLNHCRDLDERYVTWLARNPRGAGRLPEIAALLRQKGSPETVYVMGANAFDETNVPLLDALKETDRAGWGAIVSCIPGRLAYYHDEEGERRAILEHKPGG